MTRLEAAGALVASVVVVVSMFSGLLVVGTGSAVATSTEYAEDFESYDDGTSNPGGWDAGSVTLDSWSGNDEEKSFTMTGGSGGTTATNSNVSLHTQDFTVIGLMRSTDHADITVGSGTANQVDFHRMTNNNDIRLDWYDSAGNYFSHTIKMSLSNSDWVKFKVRSNGTTLRLKVWRAGNGEPASWNYTNTSSGITNETANLHMHAGDSDTMYVDWIEGGDRNFNGTSPNEVNGTVYDDDGDPVENATVKAVGINYDQLTGTIEEKRQKADRFRARAKHPYPNTTSLPNANWTDGTPDYSLRDGEDAVIDSADTEYAAVHTPEDWDLQGYRTLGSTTLGGDDTVQGTDVIDLTAPKVVLPADAPVVVSIWRPSEEAFVEDHADADLPGRTTEGTIVITQLNPSGDNRTRWTENTTPTVEITAAANVGTKVHETAVLQLSPGYYHIHPKGSPATGYTIAVGDPEDIATPYAERLNNSADQLDAQAAELDDWLNDKKAHTYTTTTNETGHYSLDVNTREDELDVIAYKTPDGFTGNTSSHEAIVDYYDDQLTSQLDANSLDEIDPSTVSCEDLTDYPGSFYAPDPTRSPTVDPPAENVTVGVVEAPQPPETNGSLSDELTEWLDACQENDDRHTLPTSLQEVCQQTTRAAAEDHYTVLSGMVQSSDTLEQAYVEDAPYDQLPDADSLSDSELCRELNRLDTITTIEPNSISSDPGGAGTFDGTTSTISNGADSTIEQVTENEYHLTVQKLFEGQLANGTESVAIFAHYTNGSTVVVNESYIDVATTALGNTRVTVTDYPLGSTDPAGVELEFDVVTEAGRLGEATETVDNPAYDGDAPTLESLRFSSLKPGPDDRVTVAVTPDDDSTFRRVTSVTAYDPDGNTVGSTVESGTKVAVNMSGEGVHTIRMTVEDLNGKTHVITERVTAGHADLPQPATVRAKSSPFGLYAVVGDGLQSGAVETREGGQRVIITAQVPEDTSQSDLPRELHVRTADLTIPPDARTTIRIVRGPDKESVGGTIGIVLHAPAASDDAIVYKDDTRPLTEDGTPDGQVEHQERQTVYRTSAEDGTVTLRVIQNPGLIERALWQYRTTIRPNLPFVGLITPPGSPLGGVPVSAGGGLLVVGLLAHHRRRTH